MAASFCINGAVCGKSIKTVNDRDIKIQSFDRFIHEKMDEMNIPAFSIAIINDGKIEYAKNHGVSNILTKVPVVPDSLFEAASVSKPVFAYYVLYLAAEGIIDLDRPLYTYFEDPEIELNQRTKMITARSVLMHSTGFPNWRKNKQEKLRSRFTPGTQFGYSGEGFQYLKRVISHQMELSDKDLNDHFIETIARPIGVDNLSFTWKASFDLKKVFGHRNGTPTDNGSQGPPNWFGSAGSLHTNALELAKLIQHIMVQQKNEGSIASQILEVQRGYPLAEFDSHRSLGFIVIEKNGRTKFVHAGNNGDTRAYCHFYKDSGFGIIMFGNSDNFFASQFADTILNYLDEELSN